jgi:UDP-3-O-[3-hydroxymyristoyl] N-acetylglucosamine deacetylase/3-hydroxyacyl-[acyl-carrier-protein] dehydratase
MIKQQTIQTEVVLSGVGLHTGKQATVTLKPAEENHGIKFTRSDLEGCPTILADANNVTEVARGTTLEQNGAVVTTVEHCLAAIAGLEIDNITIDLNASEMPILDGSSYPFYDAILKAGIKEQEAERIYFELTENVCYKDEERGVEILAVPSESYKVRVMIDYDSPVIGTQHSSLDSLKDFGEAIASSRTFCFLHELEELLEGGLIKGGDLNNAIVVVDKVLSNDELSHLRKLFENPTIQVKEEGILDNIELRHKNEPARHKLLDVIGDLALIGTPIKAQIFATRPGHAANIEFAKKVKALIKKAKQNEAPKYDPSKPPLFDIVAIEKLLPHRIPFLLVDKILSVDETTITGLKNVTMNEWFFQGHFPGQPIMPGVLQIEALAQMGGIFALNQVEDPENYLTFFMKVNEAKFKQKVVPGDTLLFSLKLMTPIRRGIVHMSGKIFVGNRVVMEGDLLAQLAKVK